MISKEEINTDIMNFTFGITTDYSDPTRLDEIVASIRKLKIPNYEILIIGQKLIKNQDDVRYLFFDEENSSWITRKKNILAYTAEYENIVLMHDYYVFDKNWYKKFKKFGNDWEICSNAQLLITGQRHFTDWVTLDDPLYPRWTALPYDEWSRTQYQYISGGFFLLKKHVIVEEPFNETMGWGTGEDVEWSLRVRNKYLMKCNKDSIVKHNKIHRDAR